MKSLKKMMIVRVAGDFDFNDPPLQIKEAMDDARIEFPEDFMLGTKKYLSRRLVLVMTTLSRGELTSWFNGVYPSRERDVEGKKIDVDLGLKWMVMASEDTPIPQVPLLKFFKDIETFDENGDSLGTTPITDLTGILQTYAGRNWKF